MTTFYLIRHGTRVDRSEETALSPLGEQQAKQTAEFLANKGISAIYSSPVKRVQQTAQIISDQINVPIITEDRLIERMIYDGSADDTFEEFLAEWDKTMNDRKYQPVYGDSAYAAGARALSFIDELPDGGKHVILSHGGVIGDTLRNLFSDNQLQFKTDPATSLRWVDIPECSISEISREDKTYLLKKIADTNHLISRA